MERFYEKNAIRWEVDNGILTVSGEGKISDPLKEWDSLKSEVRELRIAEGITEIGVGAFSGWDHLEKVTLPDDLKCIRAYAFRDCTALKEIACGGRNFRYIYDHVSLESEEPASIVFGLEAFHNTPWSRKTFGRFYIRDGALFIAFPSDEMDLEIPEGVRDLKLFAMNHLKLNSLSLPKTLEHIENFAFSDSVVKKPVSMPGTVKLLDEYALADCAIVWKDNKLLAEKLKEYAKFPKEKRSRFPKRLKRYSVVLESRKKYGGFKKLVIKDRTEKPNGISGSYILDDSLDYMDSLLKKIQRGHAMINIDARNNVVDGILSFRRKDWIGEIQGQWSAPVRTGDGVVPQVDGQAFFTTAEFKNFWEGLGRRGEWYSAEDAGLCSQYDLLKVWQTLHPDVKVRSQYDRESLKF